MFDTALVRLLIGYSGVMAAGMVSFMIGASIYDIKEAKTVHNIRLHPFTKQNKCRHKILIIIYAGNKTKSVTYSLQSIFKSSYRNYDVMVVDDTHNPSTTIKNEVETFGLKYKKSSVSLLRRRKKTSRLSSIHAAIKKSSTSDLIMVINSGSIVDKNTLGNINRHFLNEKLMVLYPNKQVAFAFSVWGLYQALDQMLINSSKKLTSLIRSNNLPIEPYAVFRSSLKSGYQLNSPDSLKYGSDVIIRCLPTKPWRTLLGLRSHQKGHIKRIKPAAGISKASSFRRSHIIRAIFLAPPLHILRLSILVTPLVITYLLYLAIYLKHPDFYVISWAIFSVLSLCIIFSNKYIGHLEKLSLILLVPLMYSIFYVINSIRFTILFLLKAIPNTHKQLKPSTKQVIF